MTDRKLKRREFLKLSAVTAVGALAAACGAKETPTEVLPPTEVPPTQTPVIIEKEATVVVQQTVEVPKGRTEPPLLKAKVDAGELPPVDERLPAEPAVVGGRDEIGVYGGEVRMIHFDPVWMVSNYDWNSERVLHYSDIDARTIVPNIIEGWEVTPDGKEYTLKLRKGMKWSDGEPVTSEDIRFYFEDIWYYNDLVASPPWQYRFGGENTVVEIIDDFTVKMTFAAPFGNFPAHMTRFEPGNWSSLIGPSHFYKQFHKEYVDEAELVAAAQEAGLETWQQLFNQHWQWGLGVWQGPDWIKDTPMPTISPWNISEVGENGLFLWERNPYYWKVDLEGNQLPYIDNLRMDYITTTDAAKLKLAQAELDALGQHDVTMADYPFYKQNEATSNYKVMDYVSAMGDRDVFFPQHYLNMEDGSGPDTVMNDIVNHPNFVKALSMAIDRDEINQSLFYGTARMGQLAPVPTSKYYKEKYGTAWAQFDKDLANQMLDEMGLDKKNSAGIRLKPDGQPLTYLIEQAGLRVGPLTAKISEMVAAYWREVGIDASTKEGQEALINDRLQNGFCQCTVWHADRCTDMLLHIEMRWYIPTNGGQGGPSSIWEDYYNAADKSTVAVVPPDQIIQYFTWFDEMTSVVSEEERVAIGQKIFDGLAENPLSIGLILEIPAPLIFNRNMRNLPRPRAVLGWDSYGNSMYHPEAFFYVGGERA